MPSADSWWVLVVLIAAAAQTARNVAQRSVGRTLGTAAGTCARFAFGLPISAAIVVLIHLLDAHGTPVPRFELRSMGWLGLGAVGQLLGTAALVAAMRRQSFATAVTCAKTEVLQAALLGAILLGEIPRAASVAGMCVSLLGIWMLSRASSREAGVPGSLPGIAFAVGGGGAFALAAVAFRESGVLLAGTSSIAATAAWSVLLAQTLQTVLLVGWLGWRDAAVLRGLVRGWRPALSAGGFGALASVFWFAAFVLRPAADVMALGMVEVVFGCFVTRYALREPMQRQEVWGVVLVAAGAAAVCLVPPTGR